MAFLYFTHQSLERDCAIDTYGVRSKLADPPRSPSHHERTPDGCTHILHMDRAQLIELRDGIDKALADEPTDAPSVADVLAGD
jgi:hypothetical protein